jgi:DHA3 family macrolide efflux protein-like MFS transporter
MAMTPLGLLVAGPVSDAIGIRAWYWIAGIVTLLMGIAGFLIPAVMHVEDQPDNLQDNPVIAASTPPG